MKLFRLYWLNGQTEVKSGHTVADAFMRAGYGTGAVAALDFFEEVSTENDPFSYTWDSATRHWKPLQKLAA